MINGNKNSVLLMILDGWGVSNVEVGNAVKMAKTPTMDGLMQNYPHALLSASGVDVGLPEGQMGNSEVGHLHIGAGRLVPQDLRRIDVEITSGAFFENPVLVDAVDKVRSAGSSLHIFGLLSNGGVHSRNTHIEALAQLCVNRGLKNFYVHAFLDGRDTPPKSAKGPLESMENKLKSLGCGKIASISGRFYSMDRDNRWERIEKSYDMLVAGTSDFCAESALAGLNAAYARGETDEFVAPTCICSSGSGPADAVDKIVIKDNDVVIFMNFRADRGRELSLAFMDQNFFCFDRKVFPKLADYITLTEYSEDLSKMGVKVVYSAIDLTNVLGEVISKNGMKQLRIAETEKYAHVTYFLNGGREMPFEGEDRVLVQSPKVKTYDLQPEMSACEVTEKLIDAIKSQKYDLIICNYANPDMVGHTGNLAATMKAVEKVDACLGKVLFVAKEISGLNVIVSADHGNAEQMINPGDGQVQTAHTTNLVPFIVVSKEKMHMQFITGSLTDVAPTILYLLKMVIPKEMTGRVLIN